MWLRKNTKSSITLFNFYRRVAIIYLTKEKNCWLFKWNFRAAAAAAKSLQSCPTLCDPIDGRPSGSPVPGILQARTLEWVAISFSKAGKRKVKVKSLSRVPLLATPWTAAFQAPLSMGFSRQEYWSGVPLPSLELPWFASIQLVFAFTMHMIELIKIAIIAQVNWKKLEEYCAYRSLKIDQFQNNVYPWLYKEKAGILNICLWKALA